MKNGIKFSVKYHAKKCNEKGCQLSSKGEFREALPWFDKAIRLNPFCSTLFLNRCICYLGLKMYNVALHDSRRCLKLNPSHIQAYETQSKCYIRLGDFEAAKRCLDMVPISQTTADITKNEQLLTKCLMLFQKYESFKIENNNLAALEAISELLSIATHCNRLKLMKADLLCLLNRYEDAVRIVSDVFNEDAEDPTAYCIRGQIHFVKQDFKAAISDLEHALELSPSFSIKVGPMLKKAKLLVAKKEASDEIAVHNYEKALEIYQQALDIDPTDSSENAKLYFNRSVVWKKLGNLKAAAASCTLAIQLDDKYLKAYLRRAQLHREMSYFPQSISDYQKVVELSPNEVEYRQLLETTKNEWEQWLQIHVKGYKINKGDIGNNLSQIPTNSKRHF